MSKFSLDALAREQLDRAKHNAAGRSSVTVYGGHEHTLRQTLIAMRAGTALSEHTNPGEATIHVLRGRVQLVSGGDVWDGAPGDLLIVPDALHSLQANDDSVVVLTVAKHDMSRA